MFHSKIENKKNADLNLKCEPVDRKVFERENIIKVAHACPTSITILVCQGGSQAAHRTAGEA